MILSNNSTPAFDVAVIGAGVFGAWPAYRLRHAGLSVALIEAHGPANSRASSGGESRIIRMGYGADEIYTRSALHSMELWQEFISQIQSERPPELLHRTGVLWLAHEGNEYVFKTQQTLERVGVRCERLSASELERSFPQINFAEIGWGLLEPESGVLMARQLVQALVREAVSLGVTYLREAVVPITDKPNEPSEKRRLNSITTRNGHRIVADKFVFACGAWLPAVFPDLLSSLIHATRQEVFFFGVPAGDLRFNSPAMPVWIDFHDLVYAIPDIEGRGLKLAIDAHGDLFDPETGDRNASATGLKSARKYLERRLPALRDAPVLETRVCQYENTSNGDFLIDRHPGFENVWLMGGGSGHGFKHGPAVGEYVATLVSGGNVVTEQRFALASKAPVQERAVY